MHTLHTDSKEQIVFFSGRTLLHSAPSEARSSFASQSSAPQSSAPKLSAEPTAAKQTATYPFYKRTTQAGEEGYSLIRRPVDTSFDSDEDHIFDAPKSLVDNDDGRFGGRDGVVVKDLLGDFASLDDRPLDGGGADGGEDGKVTPNKSTANKSLCHSSCRSFSS